MVINFRVDQSSVFMGVLAKALMAVFFVYFCIRALRIYRPITNEMHLPTGVSFQQSRISVSQYKKKYTKFAIGLVAAIFVTALLARASLMHAVDRAID